MSLLDRITHGRKPSPRRVLLYGQHGVGKSSWAAGAPGALFLPIEDGVDELDVARLPFATCSADVEQWIGELYQQEHDYRALVVDSVDWLERMIWGEVAKAKKVNSIEELPYGKGYVFAIDRWRELLEGLDALRRQRDMHIILIAHAAVRRFDPPDGDSYDRYEPKLHKHASALLQEWASEVLFASYKVLTRSSDEGFGRSRTRGIGTGERVLRTTERPSHVAKNRLGLPDPLPLEWAAFAEHIQQPQPTQT